jgi:hypothetical protein
MEAIGPRPSPGSPGEALILVEPIVAPPALGDRSARILIPYPAIPLDPSILDLDLATVLDLEDPRQSRYPG